MKEPKIDKRAYQIEKARERTYDFEELQWTAMRAFELGKCVGNVGPAVRNAEGDRKKMLEDSVKLWMDELDRITFYRG